MEKRIIFKDKEELLNVLIYDNCWGCIKQCEEKGYASVLCPIDNITKRIGYLRGVNGCVGACDNKLTTRNFKIELRNALDSIPQLLSFRKEIERSVRKAEESRMDKLIHSLKTQNAHAIHILSKFLPRDHFSYHVMSVIDEVKDIVKNNKKLTALNLLRLAKINSEMSDEIFIYENLMHRDSSYRLSIRSYDLRDVILLVFREFMPEFNANNVIIDLMPFTSKVPFDFRVIRFIIYHLTANVVKYVQPKTTFSVSFDESNEDFTVVSFKMNSCHITQEDMAHIYEEGYSGVVAKKIGKAGQGIGMHLIDKMLNIHQAKMDIIPGNEIIKIDDIDYSDNQFVLYIPKHIKEQN